MTPEQRGVTIMQDRDTADLYSTDSVRISWMEHSGQVLPPSSHCIYPTVFCEQLVDVGRPGAALYSDLENNVIYCDTGTVIAGSSHDVLLFAKVVEDDEPVNFRTVVREHINPDTEFFAVPDELKYSLDRAAVLLDDGEPAEFEVNKGFLYLFANVAGAGQIDDALRLEGRDYQQRKLKADPALVKKGLDGREYMGLTNECIIMKGPANFHHIVGSKE